MILRSESRCPHFSNPTSSSLLFPPLRQGTSPFPGPKRALVPEHPRPHTTAPTPLATGTDPALALAKRGRTNRQRGGAPFHIMPLRRGLHILHPAARHLPNSPSLDKVLNHPLPSTLPGWLKRRAPAHSSALDLSQREHSIYSREFPLCWMKLDGLNFRAPATVYRQCDHIAQPSVRHLARTQPC